MVDYYNRLVSLANESQRKGYSRTNQNVPAEQSAWDILDNQFTEVLDNLDWSNPDKINRARNFITDKWTAYSSDHPDGIVQYEDEYNKALEVLDYYDGLKGTWDNDVINLNGAYHQLNDLSYFDINNKEDKEKLDAWLKINNPELDISSLNQQQYSRQANNYFIEQVNSINKTIKNFEDTYVTPTQFYSNQMVDGQYGSQFQNVKTNEYFSANTLPKNYFDEGINITLQEMKGLNQYLQNEFISKNYEGKYTITKDDGTTFTFSSPYSASEKARVQDVLSGNSDFYTFMERENTYENTKMNNQAVAVASNNLDYQKTILPLNIRLNTFFQTPLTVLHTEANGTVINYNQPTDVDVNERTSANIEKDDTPGIKLKQGGGSAWEEWKASGKPVPPGGETEVEAGTPMWVQDGFKWTKMYNKNGVLLDEEDQEVKWIIRNLKDAEALLSDNTVPERIKRYLQGAQVSNFNENTGEIIPGSADTLESILIQRTSAMERIIQNSAKFIDNVSEGTYHTEGPLYGRLKDLQYSQSPPHMTVAPNGQLWNDYDPETANFINQGLLRLGYDIEGQSQYDFPTETPLDDMDEGKPPIVPELEVKPEPVKLVEDVEYFGEGTKYNDRWSVKESNNPIGNNIQAQYNDKYANNAIEAATKDDKEKYLELANAFENNEDLSAYSKNEVDFYKRYRLLMLKELGMYELKHAFGGEDKANKIERLISNSFDTRADTEIDAISDVILNHAPQNITIQSINKEIKATKDIVNSSFENWVLPYMPKEPIQIDEFGWGGKFAGLQKFFIEKEDGFYYDIDKINEKSVGKFDSKRLIDSFGWGALSFEAKTQIFKQIYDENNPDTIIKK